MKKVFIAVLVAAVLLLLEAPIALANPEKGNPSPASNVELVKKVTLHGKPSGGSKAPKQAATGVLGDTLGSGAKRYAIVVGISDYPGTGSDLDYADDDATAMYDALTTYGYAPANINLLTDMEASYDAIRDAVVDVKGKAETGDEVVFFFSGHGAKGQGDPDGDGEKVDEAIVSHNGYPDGEFKYIWDGELREWFSDFATNRIIFIFDSCLSGGMTDLATPGRVINMATTENGTGYESDYWGGGHGQFTYYFVDQGMIVGNADRYNSIQGAPDVTVEEAFDYAKANCQSQTPTIRDSFTNDLLL
jgi:hypothetical protein